MASGSRTLGPTSGDEFRAELPHRPGGRGTELRTSELLSVLRPPSLVVVSFGIRRPVVTSCGDVKEIKV